MGPISRPFSISGHRLDLGADAPTGNSRSLAGGIGMPDLLRYGSRDAYRTGCSAPMLYPDELLMPAARRGVWPAENTVVQCGWPLPPSSGGQTCTYTCHCRYFLFGPGLEVKGVGGSHRLYGVDIIMSAYIRWYIQWEAGCPL